VTREEKIAHLRKLSASAAELAEKSELESEAERAAGIDVLADLSQSSAARHRRNAAAYTAHADRLEAEADLAEATD
jgi:hypothetical protein